MAEQGPLCCGCAAVPHGGGPLRGFWAQGPFPLPGEAAIHAS